MLSQLLGYLNIAAAIAVVFGLCLMFHEAGHFVVAKLCGMKVEEFALGFGPSLWRMRRGETLYRFNLLFCIGAYVRIAGMEPGAEEVERGFHSRPRWQGALVIFAGPAFNVLLAVFIFASVILWKGVSIEGDQRIFVGKVATSSPAAQAGVVAGDQIVAVDGQRFSLDVAETTPQSPASRAGFRKKMGIIKINGAEVSTPAELLKALQATQGPQARVEALNYEAHELKDAFVTTTLPVPPVLRQPGSMAPELRLRGILGVRFEPLTQGALVGYINARPAQSVMVTVLRQGREMAFRMVTAVASAREPERDAKGMLYTRIKQIGRIGVILRPATEAVGVPEAIKRGAVRAVDSVVGVVVSLKMTAKREVAPEFAGPVAIMAMTAEQAKIGWDAVLGWAGTISSILAVMNLFPFAPFDGFKVILLGFEAIIRRRVPPRLELVVNLAGFALIIGLALMLSFKEATNLIEHGTY